VKDFAGPSTLGDLNTNIYESGCNFDASQCLEGTFPFLSVGDNFSKGTLFYLGCHPSTYKPPPNFWRCAAGASNQFKKGRAARTLTSGAELDIDP